LSINAAKKVMKACLFCAFFITLEIFLKKYLHIDKACAKILLNSSIRFSKGGIAQ